LTEASVFRRNHIADILTVPKKDRQAPEFPTKDAILDFVRDSPDAVGKREIARAFQVSAADRPLLKAMLKELEADGVLERGRGRRLISRGDLPPVCVLDVIGPDGEGDLIARPATWQGEGAPPKVVIQPTPRGPRGLCAGDRVLTRVRRLSQSLYEGYPIKQLSAGSSRLIAAYRPHSAGARLIPTDRKIKTEFSLAEDSALPEGLQPGDLIVAEVVPQDRYGLKRARIVEHLGAPGEPRTISLIAIHNRGLPTRFSEQALAQAANPPEMDLRGRMDLRNIPLVTIDGEDARDFDDAVWAQRDPDTDGSNIGGWHAIVAIADVAFYVRPGSALDKDAYERGNSAYFPDRVVPMLPEALSNDLCSLRPGEDRLCLAVHLRIDAEGNLKSHRFERAVMRSAARLTYEQVQAARDGAFDATTRAVWPCTLEPLYGVFSALLKARERRGTLELDVPERKVTLDATGRIAEIKPRERLDSHRLIEELMISANVAAAEALERYGLPCMYRVHDEPAREKLENLRDFLSGLGMKLAKGQTLRPRQFTQLLERTANTPHYEMVNEFVLRSQAQANYSPDNIGHFGLALRRYAHFTSPIRRYADLIVHRALIRGLGLGAGALSDAEMSRFGAAADHLSSTERRAVAAERDADDRFVAAYLASHIGAVFDGRIAGVNRFGLFVRLAETGGEGFVPVSTLPDDDYQLAADRQSLTGRRWGRCYRFGATVSVEVMESDMASSSIIFRLRNPEEAAVAAPSGGTGGRPRGRGGNRRGTSSTYRNKIGQNQNRHKRHR